MEIQSGIGHFNVGMLASRPVEGVVTDLMARLALDGQIVDLGEDDKRLLWMADVDVVRGTLYGWTDEADRSMEFFRDYDGVEVVLDPAGSTHDLSKVNHTKESILLLRGGMIINWAQEQLDGPQSEMRPGAGIRFLVEDATHVYIPETEQDYALYVAGTS